MALEPQAPRLAVLIDADNATSKIAQGLFEEIAKIGEASVRRIYGDFSSSRLKSWAEILSVHAIMPHQNFAYTSGKNASFFLKLLFRASRTSLMHDLPT